MKVPLLDLKAQYARIKKEVDQAVLEVFESQYFILGPEVEGLEKEVADYVHTPYAVGVSSGTDALLISLMAEGVQPGDEILMPAYTFFATAGSVWRMGAKPVFVDINPNTYNMNPDLLEKHITDRTVGIMAVHLFGQCAPMDRIQAVANEHQLWVMEDAAQAIGARYQEKPAGSMGQYGCFSFFPSKNLGGAGDGGMVTMTDKTRYERVRQLRNHGMEPKYFHEHVGGNFRLDALQAAVLRVKLKQLNTWSEQRAANAKQYRHLFTEAGLQAHISWPEVPAEGYHHIYNQFVIRCGEQRDALKDHLLKHGIGCEIYYPLGLHQQACFSTLGYQEGDLPETEKAAEETLALPIYPELTDEQLGWVTRTIYQFFKSS